MPLWKCGLLLGSCLCLLGCSPERYKMFIQSLQDRQITSCVEAHLALQGGDGAGTLNIYTATGGADLQQCIRAMRYGQPPIMTMPATVPVPPPVLPIP